MPRLTVISGIDHGRFLDLYGQAATIGRDSTSTLRLLDTEVSRHHAGLEPTAGGGYRLTDLGSVNGLLVNEQSITSAELRPGDRISLGATVIAFSDGTGEIPAHPSAGARVAAPRTSDLPSAILRRMTDAEGNRLVGGQDARADWLRSRLANLNILYESVAAVSHILDTDQLLDRMLTLLFQSVEADRGCFLVRNSADGPLENRSARWREDVGPREEIAISRTIIDYVLQHCEGILIADASHDDRFAAGASIVRYGIREAICVPLTGRHESIGILYFDTLRPAKPGDEVAATRLTEDHLALAVAVGRQAAIAIEETRYYHALVESERLAAVGQAMASLSHHIKNILQGMKIGGELLRTGLDSQDDRSVRSGWRLLEKNQARIYDMVLDMLSYSKEREPNREPTRLANIIEEVVALVKPRADQANVALSVCIDCDVTLSVDPEGVHRALLNLVNNALDAVEGAIEPRVEIALSANDAGARLAVNDNGHGIESEFMAKLFTPFASTKGSRGTGLGLAVSRKILREHGGDIIVTSHPGAGSTFCMTFPAAPPRS